MRKNVYLHGCATDVDNLPPLGGLNEKVAYKVLVPAPRTDVNEELNGALSRSAKELGHAFDLTSLPYMCFRFSNLWKETPQGVD